MALVLVVHHTVSPTTAALYDGVLAGLRAEELGNLEVNARPALTASAADVLLADAVILLSPVNIGYISGALKHFFDQIYYPCLTAKTGLRFGTILHSGLDAAGAIRAVESITTGLGWLAVAPPMIVTGDPVGKTLADVRELASTVGAYAAGLI